MDYFDNDGFYMVCGQPLSEYGQSIGQSPIILYHYKYEKQTRIFNLNI